MSYFHFLVQPVAELQFQEGITAPAQLSKLSALFLTQHLKILSQQLRIHSLVQLGVEAQGSITHPAEANQGSKISKITTELILRIRSCSALQKADAMRTPTSREEGLFSVQKGIMILKWVMGNSSGISGEISSTENHWALPGSDVENTPQHLPCSKHCPKTRIFGQTKSHEPSQPVPSLFPGPRRSGESKSPSPAHFPCRISVFFKVNSSCLSHLQTLQCFPARAAPGI